MKGLSLPDSVAARLPRPIPLHEWAPEARAPSTAQPNARGDISRRVALKVLATAAAVPAVACGAEPQPSADAAADPADVLSVTQPPANPLARGTPTDPDLLDATVPWPRKLTDAEMVTVRALADLIIPADDGSPSASAVEAHLYVNEYVSAPYPAQEQDLVRVRGGLVWLNQQAQVRFQLPFDQLEPEQQREICDPVSYLAEAEPEHRAPARFFDLFRDLISTAFWTTDEGMADLGYRGNVASLEFRGPPPAVLERLGLT